MADGQGNINRPNTGTVPKIKYSNNAMAIHSSKDQSKSPRMSNNLVRTSLLLTIILSLQNVNNANVKQRCSKNNCV